MKSSSSERWPDFPSLHSKDPLLPYHPLVLTPHLCPSLRTSTFVCMLHNSKEASHPEVQSSLFRGSRFINPSGKGHFFLILSKMLHVLLLVPHNVFCLLSLSWYLSRLCEIVQVLPLITDLTAALQGFFPHEGSVSPSLRISSSNKNSTQQRQQQKLNKIQ